MKHRMTLVAGTAAATVSLLCAATAAGAATTAGRRDRPARGSTTPAEVRVNQVGYPPDSAKVAYAMLPGRVEPGQLHRVGQPRRGVPRPVQPRRR